ncbi:MAG: divalent cation transporter [Candidatus Altiarchaeales archaeon WOR_SM1_86-2]|nr:MAG: divalent cation transporter [Candidatus Altiarchaeales archaeon WOR_SM1_86-2]
MIIIYITSKDKKEAKAIARHLLEKKLVACANIFPIESLYWWENKIEEDNEFVLIVKTVKERFNEVKEEVKAVHSYTTPCILKIEVEANPEFLEWVKKETYF